MTENEERAIKWLKNIREDTVVMESFINYTEPLRNLENDFFYKNSERKHECYRIIIDAISELDKYREIGTLYECSEAMRKYEEKKIKKAKIFLDGKPVKPSMYNYICFCPFCNNKLSTMQNYCDNCGQALDWDKYYNKRNKG